MPSWFVALPVVAGDWFFRLPSPPAGVRLLSAVDLHLTVAFLGDVGERRASAAFQALSPSAIRRFEIRLGAVVPMGSLRRPSALSALAEPIGPEAESIVTELAAARDAMLEAAGLPSETRAMKPHVTLARLRRRAGRAERERAMAWAAATDLARPRISLDRIGLYTTARDRAARAYDILERRECLSRI